jgi:hypothetical protein
VILVAQDLRVTVRAPGRGAPPEPKDWMGWRSQAGGTRIGRPAHSRQASATMPRDTQSSTWASVMSNAHSKPAEEAALELTSVNIVVAVVSIALTCHCEVRRKPPQAN